MVTYFSNAMTGAPALSGTAGALISILDACLVSGFGLQSATSLVVASGVATVTLPSAHGISVGAYARIAGATPSGLNGDWPVTAVTSTTLKFATALADQTATGSITFKHAPLGWATEFTGTNLRAYRSADVTGTRMRLRVDDTGTLPARVVGYESMRDVNTGTGPFPTAAQVSGGLYWGKSSTADATARPWFLVGDSRTFYLYLALNATYPEKGFCYVFGDYASAAAGDAYACALTGSTDATSASSINYGDVGRGENGVQSGAYLARSYTGLGGAQQFYKMSAYCTTAAPSGLDTYSATDLAYPNGPDNGLLTATVQVLSNSALRGNLRGVLHSAQACYAGFNTGDFVTGAGSYAGHMLLALRTGGPMNYATNSTPNGAGAMFVDLTGPWS